MLPTASDVAPVQSNPASQRRVLLYALAPVLLLALLTGGLRYATETAARREADAEAREQMAMRQTRPPIGAARRVSKPPIIHVADAKTQNLLAQTVRGQLTAIASGDFAKALTFAVPPIRTGTSPDGFAQIVRNGYAAMLSAKRVIVGAARVNTDAPSGASVAMVPVTVVTQSGETARYGYFLEQQNGAWFVRGVEGSRPRRPEDE